MKRALWMLVCLMAMVNVDAEVTVDGLKYDLHGAYASVSGVEYGNTSTEIIIPATITYEGLVYNVTEVKGYAFQNSKVNQIVVPGTIKVIGEYAFNSAYIKKVSLQDGTTTIGHWAFYNSRITEITIPKTVNEFGPAVFLSCDMLRTIRYLSPTPPERWCATSFTYVPSKVAYSEPYRSINNARVIEMISFSEDTFTYTGKAPQVSWTNNVEGYTAELTMPTLSVDAGTYEINIPAKFANENESFEVEIPYTYTILPVPLTVKVDNATRLYGEENPDFSVSYTGFINGDDESVITTAPIIRTTASANSCVGTYPITMSCDGVAKNYSFKCEDGTLTVNKAPLTAMVREAFRVYGQDNPSFSLDYAGLKNGESEPAWTTEPAFTTNATKTSDVGAYTVKVACKPQNYEVTIVDGQLNVTQAPLIIKADNAARPYCGVEPKYTFTYLGFVNGDTEDVLIEKPTMTTDAVATSNVGDYALMPQGGMAKNYAIRYKEGTLTITQRPLVVQVISTTRGYGEENPDFSVIYMGFVNNETEAVLFQRPTVGTSANVRSNVGTYDICASGGHAFNYALTYRNGQLSITPKPLNVSVGNYFRPYNEENPVFTFIYDGFVANDTEASLQTKPVAKTTAVRTSDCGVYPIEVSGGYSPNYDITYSSGQLTVSKAEQAFSWEQDLTRLTVHQQVELTATASSGLPVTYTMDPVDGVEMYPAGKKTYLQCKTPCEFVITAIQNGNDNYYSTQRITKKVKITSGEADKPMLTLQSSECGTIGTKVEKGRVYTFLIQAEAGWKVHSVTFNNVDVTEMLNKENSLTTPAIAENSTLRVVYEEDRSNAVKALNTSAVKVLGTANGIKVTGVPAGETLYVYADNGVLQKVLLSDGSSMEILLPKDNVYLVKVGNHTLKVLVK